MGSTTISFITIRHAGLIFLTQQIKRNFVIRNDYHLYRQNVCLPVAHLAVAFECILDLSDAGMNYEVEGD